MTRIYTKTGDDGTTGLLFGGRVSKGGELVDATGDIDEAVSALGLARSGCADAETAALLFRIQRELFVVAADLATNPKHRDRLKPRVSLAVPEMVAELEQLIDSLTAARPLRPVFLVPGSTQTEAAIDLSRTVVRRAERHAVQAQRAGHLVSATVLHYLNRLSDLLYVLARHAAEGSDEPVSHD
jgi:cob(I)alamin adenosyltransferase